MQKRIKFGITLLLFMVLLCPAALGADKNALLLDGCTRGDYNAVYQAICEKADVNIKDEYGDYPLEIVAALEDPQAVYDITKLIISQPITEEHMADGVIVAISHANFMAVHVVLDIYDTAVVNRLHSKYGTTALITCARVPSDTTTELEFLISKGANIRQTDKYGKTAVDYAATDEFKAYLQSKWNVPPLTNEEICEANSKIINEEIQSSTYTPSSIQMTDESYPGETSPYWTTAPQVPQVNVKSKTFTNELLNIAMEKMQATGKMQDTGEQLTVEEETKYLTEGLIDATSSDPIRIIMDRMEVPVTVK